MSLEDDLELCCRFLGWKPVGHGMWLGMGMSVSRPGLPPLDANLAHAVKVAMRKQPESVQQEFKNVIARFCNETFETKTRADAILYENTEWPISAAAAALRQERT